MKPGFYRLSSQTRMGLRVDRVLEQSSHEQEHGLVAADVAVLDRTPTGWRVVSAASGHIVKVQHWEPMESPR